jgi:hypothetical protein
MISNCSSLKLNTTKLKVKIHDPSNLLQQRFLYAKNLSAYLRTDYMLNLVEYDFEVFHCLRACHFDV